MTNPTNYDRTNLLADLSELVGTSLSGVLVGIGSIVLNFSNRYVLAMQCGFEVRSINTSTTGHGCSSQTSPALFELLNGDIVRVELDNDNVITLEFEENRQLRIIPDNTGLESYVFSGKRGVYPIS
jgi:hypothetical protein